MNSLWSRLPCPLLLPTSLPHRAQSGREVWRGPHHIHHRRLPSHSGSISASTSENPNQQGEELGELREWTQAGDSGLYKTRGTDQELLRGWGRARIAFREDFSAKKQLQNHCNRCGDIHLLKHYHYGFWVFFSLFFLNRGSWAYFNPSHSASSWNFSTFPYSYLAVLPEGRAL